MYIYIYIKFQPLFIKYIHVLCEDSVPEIGTQAIDRLISYILHEMCAVTQYSLRDAFHQSCVLPQYPKLVLQEFRITRTVTL